MTPTQLYGLKFSVNFDLHDAGVPAQGTPDVVIRRGADFKDWDPHPEGEVLLEFATSEPWYTLVRLDDGRLHYRVHTIGDFLIAPNADEVEMHLQRDVAAGMDAIMTTGTLLSLLLFLRGKSVFHGSAVAVDGAAVGFVGYSGQGKTTMAALFCAEGAAAITDDVLVIDQLKSLPTVRLGSRELRLRSSSAELSDRFSGVSSRLSADDRQILAPVAAKTQSLPLTAILIPMPMRDGSALRFERLRGVHAALTLARYPRLMGWRDPMVLRRFVNDATSLASQIPVLLAKVPWGPPFPEGIVAELQEALGQ